MMIILSAASYLDARQRAAYPPASMHFFLSAGSNNLEERDEE